MCATSKQTCRPSFTMNNELIDNHINCMEMQIEKRLEAELKAWRRRSASKIPTAKINHVIAWSKYSQRASAWPLQPSEIYSIKPIRSKNQEWVLVSNVTSSILA